VLGAAGSLEPSYLVAHVIPARLKESEPLLWLGNSKPFSGQLGMATAVHCADRADLNRDDFDCLLWKFEARYRDPMSGRLKGKIAVIAGASRGCGRGIAVALGEQAATVYVGGALFGAVRRRLMESQAPSKTLQRRSRGAAALAYPCRSITQTRHRTRLSSTAFRLNRAASIFLLVRCGAVNVEMSPI
jgi:hypothetical protein